ncbi:MAG: metallophosphoesterase [Methanobacteriota archaeon]|nr:MAG: metallophosphoesterase [Euryarchaeota archaeon]
MKVGIISDIHDHREKLRKALALLQSADKLICCGDLCSPFIMRDLGRGFPGTIHIVFGNNDGDLFRLTEAANEFEHIHLHGEVADIMIDGKRFAITHFDTIARMITSQSAFDVVCFGHNHKYQVQLEGEMLKINPGEIMGELTGTATFVIYDTQTAEVTRYVID